jgi:hypothetical protein
MTTECTLLVEDGRPAKVSCSQLGNDPLSLAEYGLAAAKSNGQLTPLRDLLAAFVEERPEYAEQIRIRPKKGRGAAVEIYDGLNVIEQMPAVEFNRARKRGDTFAGTVTYQQIRDNTYPADSGDHKTDDGADGKPRLGKKAAVVAGLVVLIVAAIGFAVYQATGGFFPGASNLTPEQAEMLGEIRDFIDKLDEYETNFTELAQDAVRRKEIRDTIEWAKGRPWFSGHGEQARALEQRLDDCERSAGE